jgi:hypothetical protein
MDVSKLTKETAERIMNVSRIKMFGKERVFMFPHRIIRKALKMPVS